MITTPANEIGWKIGIEAILAENTKIRIIKFNDTQD